jgi:hypothetical protein
MLQLRDASEKLPSNMLFLVFRLERRPEINAAFPHRMKRPSALPPKQDSLVRKRALIRSLIEQHGWASVPTPSSSTTSPGTAEQAVVGNIIPFPTLHR